MAVRLDDPAAVFQGVEAGNGKKTGKPWGGTVDEFRINPNDPKDSLCFRIGRIWLTADEPAGAVLTPIAAAPIPSAPAATVKAASKVASKTTKRVVKATKKKATTRKR